MTVVSCFWIIVDNAGHVSSATTACTPECVMACLQLTFNRLDTEPTAFEAAALRHALGNKLAFAEGAQHDATEVLCAVLGICGVSESSIINTTQCVEHGEIVVVEEGLQSRSEGWHGGVHNIPQAFPSSTSLQRPPLQRPPLQRPHTYRHHRSAVASGDGCRLRALVLTGLDACRHWNCPGDSLSEDPGGIEPKRAVRARILSRPRGSRTRWWPLVGCGPDDHRPPDPQ